MSEVVAQNALQEQTRELLEGPLKHIRAAALAAALLPLASVAAAPASAQSACPASGGICGVVFNDTNNNGVKDVDENGIESVKVYVCQLCDNSDTIPTETGPDGFYEVFVPPGNYTIKTQVPTGTQPSPPNVGDDTFDSDGIPDGNAFSVVTDVPGNGFAVDFGFFTIPVKQPGTGTPGYWKNHPAAWPVDTITVGGVEYTKEQAITWLTKVGKDKTTTMFSSLVPAMLNVLVGNDGSCVTTTIAAGNAWMATFGPVGKGVSASSYAWSVGEPIHITLDNYNNGQLCAPHRQ